MSRIANISKKLLRGVGFSKGWAEFTLKKPPPLAPSCLMATWDATGPTAMSCSVRVEVSVLGLSLTAKSYPFFEPPGVAPGQLFDRA